jgi:hypothetical protein
VDLFTRRDDDGGPGEHSERWDRAATIGWLLGADVCVPGVDPRFRLATERIERDDGGGAGGDSVLFDGFVFGEWSDLVIVAAFSLVIYYWALAVAMPTEKVETAVARDANQIETGTILPIPIS